ncbi:MAG: molybdopterin-guanine dinucleotide biosynthesis protein B [Deltaproteobacteria bacterium CG2_30_63_29]|nr:MAG: molybdopterin-guanine dinucleotide biosynthesis protein B [Deltaproteobacteria bacterium CG2_30_63_29]PJB38922.1 MAG: molybdopterin-guanine dinucleotide biosynthesis protein B [Deltaproteobacteria bacterium CG_4_9_14_3_um_filter_63_12]
MSQEIPVLSIIGRQNSGKTTAVVNLVPLLKARGLTVATAKHTHHGYEMDTEGKDSWRHHQAGAAAVAVVGPTTGVLFIDRPADPLSTLRSGTAGAFDVILAEGFRSESYARVVCCPPGTSEPAEPRDATGAIALLVRECASEPTSPTPTFAADAAGFERLADLIVAWLGR